MRAHPTLRRPPSPIFMALSTPDPGSSNSQLASCERFRLGDRHSEDDAALGRLYGGRVDVAEVVDETELEAAREAEGVGRPSVRGFACGDDWALLVEVRNSSQSLLAVPFVAVNTEGEYACPALSGVRSVPSSCPPPPCGDPGHSNDASAVAVLLSRSMSMFVVCGPGRAPNIPFIPLPPYDPTFCPPAYPIDLRADGNSNDDCEEKLSFCMPMLMLPGNGRLRLLCGGRW